MLTAAKIQMDCSSSGFLLYKTSDINHPLLTENLKEINETPEIKERALDILRKELENLKDIESCMDEDFLLRFLRVSKYDTSKAVQRIINYYQRLDVFYETFKKYNFPLYEAERFRILFFSPYRCKDNSFLLIGKGNIDYKKYNFGHHFWLDIIATHTVLENPVNQICGGTFIFDYDGLDMHGYLAFTPFWIRLFVTSVVSTLPCRLKAVHIVNTPSFFPILLKLCYPLIPKKMRDRLFIHAKSGDWNDLHSHIPPDILPEKYGGKLKQEELIDGLENLKEQEKRLSKFFNFGYIKTQKARNSFHLFL